MEKGSKTRKSKSRIQDKPRNVLMGEIKPTIQSTVLTANKPEISFSRKKSCALCMIEQMCIYMAKNDPNVEKRSKLMNKKSELRVRCTCTAKFLRLTLERKAWC